MEHVVRRRRDVILYIGGKGVMREKLLKMISEKGLKKWVKLIGYVEDEAIPYWMSAADLFVFPSLYESFGLVVLESLACGTPAVATVNGGSEEIITSESYGLLVPPSDPESLAEGILEGLTRGWDREKIIGYARQFTWKRTAKKLNMVYKELMK
ncbi:MAG: glycosyltransferase, partial [Thermoplasmata archaeon]|nr:glycosyltransferase [Thermoplasmata archaeon]